MFAMIAGSLPFCDADTTKLYKKILSGNFKFPSWISSEVKDLISRILTVNPLKRIKIEEIKNHPWFQMSKYEHKNGINVKFYKMPA